MSSKICLTKALLVSVALSVGGVSSQLLGAGTGVGSCRAFPYRVEEVDWEVCPVETACCNEYGYCRTREEWNNLQFRDCNGKSNGMDLPLAVLNQESALGGVAGEALGAEKTFDISQVGKGVYGVGGFGISGGSSEFGNGLGTGSGSNEFSGTGTNGLSNSGSNGFSGSNQNRFSGSGSNGQLGGGSNKFSGSGSNGSNGVSGGGSNRFSGGGSNGSGGNRFSGSGSNVSSGPGSNRVSGSGGQRGSDINQGQVNSQVKGSGSKKGLRGSGPSSGNNRFGSSGGANTSGKNKGSSGSGGQKPGRGNNKSKNSGKSKGSESFNTEIAGSGFPLVGYENTAGFPMNLNRENCPKYPFCWWNPYQNKNRR